VIHPHPESKERPEAARHHHEPSKAMRKNNLILGTVAVALALASTACISNSKKGSSEDRERTKDYVLASVPEGAAKADVNFENKVRIVAFKVTPEVAPPGTEVKITYYWQADGPVEANWKLFTHVHEPKTDKYDNLDWNGVIREQRGDGQLLGPDKWEKGKVYVDEQTWRVPEWVTQPEIEMMVGVWKDNARLRVVSGPNDGENRAIVVKVKTGLSGEEAPKAGSREATPSLVPTKLGANDSVTIDGKATEALWAGAAQTGPFVDVGSGAEAPGAPAKGQVRFAYDDKKLYAFFTVKSAQVRGGFDKAKNPGWFTAAGQPKLWTRDTVELMIDPDGDGDNKNYFEIQVNPQNLIFKSRFDDYNQPNGGPNGPFGHEDWDAKIESAVVVHGTLDKDDDQDEGYDVEIAIPWASFTGAENAPPKAGSTWRLNAYAMKDNGGTAWSAILGQGNFHKATRFGTLRFDDPNIIPGRPAILGKIRNMPSSSTFKPINP
jgi:hypothetical protein